jgi:hypothetical protein
MVLNQLSSALQQATGAQGGDVPAKGGSALPTGTPVAGGKRKRKSGKRKSAKRKSGKRKSGKRKSGKRKSGKRRK